MNMAQQIITIISMVLGIIVTATGLLIPLIKNIKVKNALEQINKISSMIQPYVVEAEKFISYTGEKKKEYVMSKLKSYCEKNGINFDAESVSKMVEEIIATTKQVNVQ